MKMRVFVSTLLAAVMALYFACVAVYNLPPSFLTKLLGKPAYTVINPYFMQSWALFAPDPGTFQTDATFRYAWLDVAGRYHYSPWYDGNALFPRSLNGNPLQRLLMEREIYFGEVLLATNDVGKMRSFVKLRGTDVRRPVSAAQTPSGLVGISRMFMSLEPLLTARGRGAPFLVQIALREQAVQDFGIRFDDRPLVMKKSPSGSLVLPWLQGSDVPPFFDRVSAT